MTMPMSNLRTFQFAVLSLVTGAWLSYGQQAPQKTFSSAAQAAHSLFEATEADNAEALEAILGTDKEYISANDEAQNKAERKQFCEKYREMHRLVRETDGTVVLYIGAENWPFPVPLVSANGKWRFDPDSGTEEMLYRRVGEDELTAIEVCNDFAGRGEHGSAAEGDDATRQFAANLQSAGNPPAEPFHG